jgi:peptidoglycan/LPS O-acetylase OafA/YrhL
MTTEPKSNKTSRLIYFIGLGLLFVALAGFVIAKLQVTRQAKLIWLVAGIACMIAGVVTMNVGQRRLARNKPSDPEP